MTKEKIKEAATRKAIREVYGYKPLGNGMVNIGADTRYTEKEKEEMFYKIVKEETERLTKINQNQES